ncbi:MAG: glycosyltransferase family 28 [Acidimicrobiia bacterium]|nr:glycosyltransferase family 28 [Acidimicrobiia bacterium]
MRLLLHCQHALGLGHLARSLALADGLRHQFEVTLLNGGRFPAGTVVPEGVRVVNLDPLGHDADYSLVSHDPELTVDQAMARRRAAVLAELDRVDPHVLLVEMFPFGRKKFRFELEPLLEAAHAPGPRGRPRVVCSLRDILVNQRRDQAGHDERAAQLANRWFDLVLVHADPAFATLEESFRPTTPLHAPVRYTGFVTAADGSPVPAGPTLDRLLVSAGGGMAGGPLLRRAAEAAPAVARRTGLGTTVVAGPFLPDGDRARLRAVAAGQPALTVVDQVPDLAAEIARSAVSLSQCGYNTTMDLLRARRPALVVPYAEGREDEQRRRADSLARLGVVRTVAQDDLTVSRLVTEVTTLAGASPASIPFDLNGRHRSAALVVELCAANPRTSPAGAPR